MFVRAKHRRTQRGSMTHYYLVRSEREGGRVRQRVVLYLGRDKSIHEAAERLPRVIAHYQEQAETYRQKAEEVRAKIPADEFVEFETGYVPYRKTRALENWHRFHGHTRYAEYCEGEARLLSARLARVRQLVEAEEV